MPDASVPRSTLAKIVATLGPASDTPEMVRRLIEAGVAVFRLNFSHGSLEDHARRLAVVRAAASELGLPVAVLGDLPGPKIRVGAVSGSIELVAGQEVLIDPSLDVSRVDARGVVSLSATYPSIGAEVRPGERVLINDGAVRMLALSSEAVADGAAGAVGGHSVLRCRVVTGGVVTSGKGINLPETELSVPAVTERDWACVRWAVAHGLDFLALSFVRSAEEIEVLREGLAGMCAVDKRVDEGAAAMIPIVAKIEKPQAVANMESIVRASDAIMVARGDLGVEMDIAQVPVVQKQLIATADAWGKPCIVATQMLESMIHAPGPTRAEASDVANAVFDGADALMLSGETAVGAYPLLAVEMMARVIRAAEQRLSDQSPDASPPRRVVESGYRTAALAHGAWHVARDVRARLVVCWSQEGGCARYLSQTGFKIPIVACSSSERQTRRMSLLKGVRALTMPVPTDQQRAEAGGSLSAWNERIDEELVARWWARPGDAVVMLAGRPLGVKGATNALAVHYVGNPQTGFRAHR